MPDEGVSEDWLLRLGLLAVGGTVTAAQQQGSVSVIPSLHTFREVRERSIFILGLASIHHLPMPTLMVTARFLQFAGDHW
jgi:hypothetical protein